MKQKKDVKIKWNEPQLIKMANIKKVTLGGSGKWQEKRSPSRNKNRYPQ